MFDDKLITGLKNGNWEADCVSMTLTQFDVAEPRVFSGPGYLRQGTDGIVEFKLFDITVHKPNVSQEQFHGLVEGQLIARHHYYQLEAVDPYGRRWQCLQTHPDIEEICSEGRSRYVLHGQADELSFLSSSGLPQNVCALKMAFFTDAKIPCNARTISQISVGSQSEQTSFVLNLAEFSTSFGHFRISTDDGLVEVCVKSAPDGLPQFFELRIVEALTFVMGQRFHWNVVERYQYGSEVIRIRGKHLVTNNNRLAPIRGGLIDTHGQVWRLFERYLYFVCKHLTNEFHPCSRYLFMVLEARWVAISSLGLALSIAVEGIVKELFPTVAALADDLKLKVAELRAYIGKWPGYEDETTKVSLEKRVHDMLNHILEVNTKSKLIALANAKVICEKHSKAWSKLRHALAHAAAPASGDLQEIIDLCHNVAVLMYHLIFKAIGYEGIYIDYSTCGSPTKCYRGRPITAHDIAVAAYFNWVRASRKNGHDLEHWFNAEKQLEEGFI